MRIAPISFYTQNTDNTYKTDIKKNILFTSPFDTVSFKGSSATKISETIYNHIKNGEYSKALKFFKGAKTPDFNPNYFAPNAEGKNISLMGMILENSKDLKQFSKRAAEVFFLFAGILYHPDFKMYNRGAEGDLFIKAANNHIPNQMMNMLYNSDAFNWIPINSENFAKYPKILEENGYDELRRSVQQTLDDFKEMEDFDTDEDVECNEISNGNTEEEININNLKMTLGPQDPKSLDDVGGLNEVKDDIERYIIRPWHPKYKERYEKHPSIKRPSGVLLSGPPGCGKTFVAQAIAAETGYDLYYVNLSSIGSKWAYDTAKNISSIFNQLETIYKKTGKPNIVFLDEMDSIASSREDNEQDWKRDDVNAILTAINNSAQRGIIVIGATNYYNAIDKAAIRSGRVDVVIKMDYPDEKGRKDIIEKLLKKDEISSSLSEYSDEFAKYTDGYTPADIASAISIMCSDVLTSDKEFAVKEDFYNAFNIIKRKKNMNNNRTVGFKKAE